ncbi:MAG: hypothetical protein ACPG4Z_05200, partial [Chitinophagales bacterium]
ASANGKTVTPANGVNFNNKTVGTGAEPAVVGAAMGLTEGQMSAPIVGENGVFVVKVTSTTPGAILDATSTDFVKQGISSSMNSSIQIKMQDAMQDAADIEDNRFNFF